MRSQLGEDRVPVPTHAGTQGECRAALRGLKEGGGGREVVMGFNFSPTRSSRRVKYVRRGDGK